MTGNYRAILGVSKNATDLQIKSAYRRLARQLHPDINPSQDAARRFRDITTAYEALSDLTQYQEVADAHAATSDSVDDLFDHRGSAGNQNPAGSQAPQRRRQSGSDLLCDISLSLEECALGVNKEITLRVIAVCDQCHGATITTTCAVCAGDGEIPASRNPSAATSCPQCRGFGKVFPDPCAHCGGDGRVWERRAVGVTIPAGVADGTRISVFGQGHVGRGGGRAGDLHLRIVIDDSPKEATTRGVFQRVFAGFRTEKPLKEDGK
jgi:molecular chaperone DnaJ